MTRAVRSRNWKTVGIALLIAAFCIFSYRWYTSRRIVGGIETVNVGGATIAIRALTGYCNELDRDFFSPLERSDPSRYVIAVSAPCRDLTAFKTGTASGLQKYIVWSVGPTDSGTPTRLPADITRSGFANDTADAEQRIDLAEIASEVAKNGSKIGIIDEGLIDREVDAVYEAAVLSGAQRRNRQDRRVRHGHRRNSPSRFMDHCLRRFQEQRLVFRTSRIGEAVDARCFVRQYG